MLATIVGIAAAAVVLVMFLLATITVCDERWSIPVRVSTAYALIAFGVLSYGIFWLAFLWPVGGAMAGYVLAAVVTLMFVRRRAWSRVLAPEAFIVPTVALGAIAIGMLHLINTGLQGFSLAAQRYVGHQLPIDNAIPMFFAEALLNGESTSGLVSSWNGSDRPPLQSGMIMALTSVGEPRHVAFYVSVLVQLLWIPAAGVLLRTLGASMRATLIGVTFAAVGTPVMLNTVFTWPKLLAAAFTLLAIALILEAIREQRMLLPHLMMAATSFMLGFLAHGGMIFSLPLVVGTGIALVRHRGLAPTIRAVAVSALPATLLYVPWVYYQKIVDPPGDRLLKWHLGGVRDIREEGSLEVIAGAYSELGWSGTLEQKWANLRGLFVENPFSHLATATEAGHVARIEQEFSHVTAALGLAYPLLVGLLVWALVRRLQHRADGADRSMSALAALGLCSLVFWAVVIFDGVSFHLGSYATYLILMMVPIVWLASKQMRAAWAIVILQSLLSVPLLVAAPLLREEGRPLLEAISIPGAALTLVGVVMLIGYVRRLDHSESVYLSLRA